MGRQPLFIHEIGVSHAHVDRFLDRTAFDDDMIPIHNTGYLARVPDAVTTSHFEVSRGFIARGFESVVLAGQFLEIHGKSLLAVPVGMVDPVAVRAG